MANPDLCEVPMNDNVKHEPQAGDERTALPAAELNGKPLPERVLIAPWGRVDSTNGSFVVDEESASLVIAAFEAHGTDLPIDYEHQTLGGRYSSPSGQAPAAGWIKGVEVEPGVGLFAIVAWTETGAERVAGGEYRYLSPVAVVRRSDRKLIALHSAALTNKPAIAGMRPLVALRERLSLDESCGQEELLAAACARIAELEQAAMRRAADDRVEAVFRAGRLTEAQRPWAAALALRAPDLFEEWSRTAPVLVPAGRTEPPDGHVAPHRAAHAVEAAARAEYHAHPDLAAVTSEEAFVAQAVRERGLGISDCGFRIAD
jgi:phage I-like protein